ncbi:MAG: aminoacyl-tRNA deacylase [Actinomycetota bacterium]
MAVPEKITGFLRDKGVEFDEVEHSETFTSADEAKAIGVDADEVAKVIVVRHQAGRALFVLPASHRIHMNTVRKVLGDKKAQMAREEEMEADLSDYALGAVPPFGELVGAPLYLDEHLSAHETVVFAAGTHTDSIRMRVGYLPQLGTYELVEVCKPDA